MPYVGDLFLEHTFYMLDDEPILFVCKGIGDIRYLCSCCRLYEKWVVGQVAETELINLIDDKVSIREVFENCDTKFVVRWDGKRFKVDGDVHDNLIGKSVEHIEGVWSNTGSNGKVSNWQRSKATTCYPHGSSIKKLYLLGINIKKYALNGNRIKSCTQVS